VDEDSNGKHTYALKDEYTFRISPELSEWLCYLWGNRPNGVGIIYRPMKGREPNWFVRWMMKICFDCLWVKDDKNGK
jgi:hypothetical protein